MIDRYTRNVFRDLWRDSTRFAIWLDVELAVLQAQGEKGGRQGGVPKNAASKIRSRAKINVARILKLEDSLKHDVIAFTTSISEQVGEVGRYFHYGLTSSDVVDTAFSIQMRAALELIKAGLMDLLKELEKLAVRNRPLPCIGRTHGVHAEPTSFGLKFVGYHAEFQRSLKRIERAEETISYGKLSGAVGVYGELTPEIERKALSKLGLKPEPVATQVIPRDRHAEVFSVLAGLGASIERVAVELRHLQRTEVGEVEEDFMTGQKGSSAMPHKKNPISAENLTGCARLLRGYAVAASENVALWHERDISHSSVERVIGPDATSLADYMIHRLIGVLQRLKVNEARVAENLNLTRGTYFSGRLLLRCVEKGISREAAYVILQKAAHAALAKRTDFKTELWKDSMIRELFKPQEFNRVFDVRYYLRHVDAIYKRVLG